MARCGLILELTRPRTADKIETAPAAGKKLGRFLPGGAWGKSLPRWLKGRADTGGQ